MPWWGATLIIITGLALLTGFTLRIWSPWRHPAHEHSSPPRGPVLYPVGSMIRDAERGLTPGQRAGYWLPHEIVAERDPDHPEQEEGAGPDWDQLEREQAGISGVQIDDGGWISGPCIGPDDPGPGEEIDPLPPPDDEWTPQQLAELHDAPTVLDALQTSSGEDGSDGAVPGSIPGTTLGGSRFDPGPSPEDPAGERLADTGEIALASIRAEHQAQLAEQDADAADWCAQLIAEVQDWALAVRTS